LALGALFGVLATRRFVVAAVGFGIFGVVGFLAALGQPLADPAMVAVQAAASTAVSIQTLSWLLGRLRPVEGRSSMADPARRSFLLRTTAVGIGALAAGAFGRTAIASSTSSPTPSIPLPPPVDVVPPLPAEADLAPSTPGLTPIVVPNDDFYRIDTALLVPSLDTATWQLRIHGLVERETTLTWDQLISQPMFEQYCTIACVSNEVGGHLVGNTKWTGVRLRDVLAMAAPTAQATQLVGRSVDGWTAGMPMSWVMDPAREPMIAVEMDGQPLPRRHGYPARLIVPGLYGYVSATKWLWELELTTWESYDGYWVPLGWSKEGPILTQSRIDTPTGNIATGSVAIAGVAWARIAASARSRSVSTTPGTRHVCPPRSRRRRGSSGRTPGTRRRVRIVSRCVPPMAPARCRTRSRRDRLPTAPAAGTPWTSTSADGRWCDWV
jgi:DMSO/TMAO reductase YedYZ molybdopterin-dependent catalytic subunit